MTTSASRQFQRILKIYRQEFKQQQLLVAKASQAVIDKRAVIESIHQELNELSLRFCDLIDRNSCLIAPQLHANLAPLAKTIEMHRAELKELEENWQKAKTALVEQARRVEAIDCLNEQRQREFKAKQTRQEEIEMLERVLATANRKKGKL